VPTIFGWTDAAEVDAAVVPPVAILVVHDLSGTRIEYEAVLIL
jgi:hypothetical protein